MFIVEVIPIKKSVRVETLTYFHKNSILPGRIVIVPIRKKDTLALVVASTKASYIRSTLKNQEYSLRKIKEVTKTIPFHPALTEACQIEADKHATTTGALTQSMLPKFVFSNIDELKSVTQPIKKQGKESQEIPERYLIQEPEHDRVSTYKKIIRTSFAQKQSVVLVCPTIAECDFFKEALSKGIESYVYTINSSLSTKKQISVWNESADENHSVVIICTPKYSLVPRNDIGTFILEHESSQQYRSQRAPYTDYREVLQVYATNIGAQIYLGDITQRAERLMQFDEGTYIEESSLQFRHPDAVRPTLIDMKALDTKLETFRLLSDETEEILKNNNLERVFLYVSRKGLAPSIGCVDCGTLVTCHDCSAPMTLYGAKNMTGEKARFRCNHCGSVRPAQEKCTYCDGWRLSQFGIGTETIYEHLKKHHPQRDVFIVDKEHTKTHPQTKKTITAFMETRGGVLIGTEQALPYIHENIEHVHIVSVDALFSLPHYTIKERIMRLLLRLQNKASRSFIVQTRMTNEDVYTHLKNATLPNFYRDEFTARKKFDYPPFTTLIKISVANTPAQAKKQSEEIKAVLDTIESKTHFESIQYLSPYKERGKAVGNILIKAQEWPDELLVRYLRSLPPQYRIMINPQNLF